MESPRGLGGDTIELFLQVGENSRLEWLGLGMETDYTNYKLGMSKKRADWLASWLGEKSNSGKVAAKEMQQGGS